MLQHYPNLFRFSACSFSQTCLIILKVSQIICHFSAVQTLRFSRQGHGAYLCTPSEIQKFTVDAELAGQITQSLGELFQVIGLVVGTCNISQNIRILEYSCMQTTRSKEVVFDLNYNTIRI